MTVNLYSKGLCLEISTCFRLAINVNRVPRCLTKPKTFFKRDFHQESVYKKTLDDQKIFTASHITIGEELLEGKRQEENSMTLASSFQDNPIQLKRIEVIPDCKEEIKRTILEHCRKYDLVFTSGNLSSKHEVKIYETVAEAFGYNLSYHQPTLTRMDKVNRFLSRSTSPEMMESRKKLAKFPEGSRVVYPCQHQWLPIVIVNSKIHIMPGAPDLFRDLASDYFKFPIVDFLGLRTQS